MFLKREGPQVARLEKVEVQPCAIGPLPVTGVIPSVHGLANPAGTARAGVSKWRREHFPWLPSECCLLEEMGACLSSAGPKDLQLRDNW